MEINVLLQFPSQLKATKLTKTVLELHKVSLLSKSKISFSGVPAGVIAREQNQKNGTILAIKEKPQVWHYFQTDQNSSIPKI